MIEKLRIGILFGGQSAEHDISLQSARFLIEQINRDRYDIFPIRIDQQGRWHFLQDTSCLLALKENRGLSLQEEPPPFPHMAKRGMGSALFFSPSVLKSKLDLLFPMLHGPYGEDGTVQGVAKLAHLPCVGADVLGSAICMDKGVMKTLLQGGGLPTPRFLVFHQTDPINYGQVIKELGLPLFLKPANGGSSLGINKVFREEEFSFVVEEAFKYDERIIFEESIEGRELECAVLGNLEPIASLPGEVIPRDEFYTYAAKYLDANGACFEIPAKISQNKVEELQELAVKAFKVLQCEGMARVDFFLRNSDGQLFLNELNTLPGFTSISLYPKLWERSGMTCSALIDRLITLAINRFDRKKGRM